MSDKVRNCWLQAASLAVVLTSPEWTSNLFYDKNGTALAGAEQPTLVEAVIKLWDPNAIARTDSGSLDLNMRDTSTHLFPINVTHQSKTEDRHKDLKNDRWWNSGVLQAILQLGTTTNLIGVHAENGTIDELGGDAGVILTALTGYPSVSKRFNDYGGQGSALYNDLANAYNLQTPIVISTRANTSAKNSFPNSILKGSHAYAVRWVEEKDGVKTAILANPWGLTEVASMTEILSNMQRVVYLENFKSLDWTRSAEELVDYKNQGGGQPQSKVVGQGEGGAAVVDLGRRGRGGGSTRSRSSA